MNNLIIIGADHRGFAAKEAIKKWLLERKYTIEDMGALQYEEDDDYVDYAQKVSEKVGNVSGALGLLFCGSGVGMCIVANKFKGVRAALGVREEIIQAARSDDDINILCLAADYTSTDEMQTLINTFLSTPFEQEERFIRRLKKIGEIEG
ncbi:MAG: ribose 5-phosphate isomerase B [Patescibacteria group bacterium]|nr:MAG: ribose 5-phosphate isomerase B [Patescibacteria group bacterium]